MRTPQRLAFQAIPEFAQAIETLLKFVARNNRAVDRADRGADHPIGLDLGLVQCLINPALIGAERAAALKHQNDLARHSR